MKVGRVIAPPLRPAGTATTTPGHRQPQGFRHRATTRADALRLGPRRRAARCTPSARSATIFSMQGITDVAKGPDAAELMEHLSRLTGTAEDGSLTFANFVEFDSIYGHRRDVSGYAPRARMVRLPGSPPHRRRSGQATSCSSPPTTGQRPDLDGHRPHPRAGAGRDPRGGAG